MRVLLKAGHDSNQRVEYGAYGPLEGTYWGSCTAAHLCLTPPRLSDGDPDPPPQLACFEVLVQEGKVDINAVGTWNYTPLHFLAEYAPRGDAHLAVLDLLVRLGADLEARDKEGRTPVFGYAQQSYLAGMPLGRSAGVLAGVLHRAVVTAVTMQQGVLGG